MPCTWQPVKFTWIPSFCLIAFATNLFSGLPFFLFSFTFANLGRISPWRWPARARRRKCSLPWWKDPRKFLPCSHQPMTLPFFFFFFEKVKIGEDQLHFSSLHRKSKKRPNNYLDRVNLLFGRLKFFFFLNIMIYQYSVLLVWLNGAEQHQS